MTAWQPSGNFATGTVSFNTAFAVPNNVNLLFSVSRLGTWGVNGNYTDDTTIYEVSKTSTYCTVGIFDVGTHDAGNRVVVSFYWQACGY